MRDMVKFYASILILVISSFAFVTTIFTFKQAQRDATTEVNETIKSVGYILNHYQNEARRVTYSLFSTPEETADLNYYFLNDYQSYNSRNLYENYVYFPKKVNNLYLEYDDLDGLSIQFKNEKEIYVSTDDHRFGTKTDQYVFFNDSIMFSQVLINQISYETLGYVNLYIDKDAIDNQIIPAKENLFPGVLITNEFGSIIYHSNPRKPEVDQNFDKDMLLELQDTINNNSYIVKSHQYGDYSVNVYMPNDAINKQAFATYSWIILSAIILDTFLVYVLYQTFGEYSEQVEDIIDCISEVKEGDYSFRIDLENKGTELYNISNGINEMLNNITDYIDTIYQLEVKQRDITLMALQSQINPHFLYNTLEFIRMYAVSEGVDELAEIVFSFSELLRNNISLERETTLAKEIEFTENYIYLYQMRYPDRLAYKVSIDENLKNILIPKFTLQPLIENYVKHGVDFNRIDNAIYIHVSQENERVVIELEDNGRGTTQENLEKIREKLNRKEIDIQSGSSIGLYNVHERLKAYFKEAYHIEIESEINKGFKITITLDADMSILNTKLYCKEDE